MTNKKLQPKPPVHNLHHIFKEINARFGVGTFKRIRGTGKWTDGRVVLSMLFSVQKDAPYAHRPDIIKGVPRSKLIPISITVRPGVDYWKGELAEGILVPTRIQRRDFKADGKRGLDINRFCAVIAEMTALIQDHTDQHAAARKALRDQAALRSKVRRQYAALHNVRLKNGVRPRFRDNAQAGHCELVLQELTVAEARRVINFVKKLPYREYGGE